MKSSEKELLIRGEREADLAAIHEINLLAFGQEDEAKLVDSLRKGKSYIKGLSLVAIKEDKVIGHAIFTKAFIVNKAGKRQACIALGPMAVHPEHQRHGIGIKLVEEGLERGRELAFNSAVVLGHKEYYPRFGFKPASERNIRSTFPGAEEYFFILELKGGGLKGISGVVQYAREFSMLAEAKKKEKPKEPATEMPNEIQQKNLSQQSDDINTVQPGGENILNSNPPPQ
ncbi:MAG: N-acetyltransferase [Ignavibacteria bacterium]|nr:N-acetyltransferase [Ignavibacteria bacterium]